MSALFKIDMRIFEDWNQRLAVLGEHFSYRVPRASKDPLVNRLILEARLHAFLACHTSLSELLQDMYKDSPFSTKQGSNPSNAIGEVLSWMYQQKMITAEDLNDFAEQFDSAMLFSYDREWLDTRLKLDLFDERSKKLSRYYYRMSTFSGMLTQRLVIKKEPENVRV